MPDWGALELDTKPKLDWSALEEPKLDWSALEVEPEIRAPRPTDYIPRRLPPLEELQKVEPYLGIYKRWPKPLQALGLSFSRSFGHIYRKFGKVVVPEELKAQEEFLSKEYPALTKVGEIGGNIALYTAAVATGAPLPVAFAGVGGMTEAARVMDIPDLTTAQKAGRIGVASGAGALTGKIFQMAGLGKTALSRILQRAGGAGAITVAETLTNEMISKKEPDVLNALVTGGTQAVIIGALGTLAEVPALRHSIFREATRLNRGIAPKTHQEAVNIVKQAGISPERLSPTFQTAIYEAKRRAVLSDINIYAKKHGIPVQMSKEILAERSLLGRQQLVTSWLVKLKKTDPARAAALSPFIKQIEKGADPVDILIGLEMQKMLKTAPPITRVVTAPAEKTYDLPPITLSSTITNEARNIIGRSVTIRPDLWYDINYAIGGKLMTGAMKGSDIIRFQEAGTDDAGVPFTLVGAAPMSGVAPIPPPEIVPKTPEGEILVRAATTGVEPPVETVTKIVSKYPQRVVDQKSLEEVGNAIARDMGITQPITWVYREYPRMVIRYRASASIRPSPKIRLTVRKGPPDELVGPSPSQGTIKSVIVHELVHLLPEMRKLRVRGVMHPPGFYERLAEERVTRLFDITERTIPVKNIDDTEYEEIQKAVMSYSGLAPMEESAVPVEPPPPPPPTTAESPGVPPPEEKPSQVELMEPTGLKALFTKIFKVIDIELPWKVMGAPDTGFHIKNYFSEVGAHEDYGYNTIKHLTRTTKLTPSEYVEVTYYAAQPSLFEKVSKEKATILSEAYHQVRQYFKRYVDILKKLKIIVDPWPQSMIYSIQEGIRHTKEIIERVKESVMPTGLKEYRLSELLEEVAEMESTINFLKREDIQYVHIPVRLWLEDLFKKNPVQARRVINRFFKERTTVDIRELASTLIKEGIITEEDVDIRNIIASYASTVGRKIALSHIINAAKKEGLIRPSEEKPDWVHFPRRLAPELKGMRVHPAFSEWLESYSQMPHPRMLGRLFAYAKIMAFTNPILLPAYDLYQAFWLGSIRSIRTPISVFRAIRSMLYKDEAYYNAYENGAFSQPFTPPFDQFMRNIEVAKSYDSFLHMALTYLRQNLKVPTDLIYKPMWHMAWGGDRLIRLISYHHLKQMGATDREAAQLSALFHSDYASVPIKTRNKLNHVFFTPIFPITMGKLQAQMIISTGKVFASAARMKVPKARDTMLATGLLTLLGLVMLRDTILRKLGYKRDVFGYRYSKEVVDANGESKELVVSIPAPDNVILRYLHNFTFAPYTAKRMWAFVNRASWRLHPIYRTAYCVATNKREDARTPIYHPFSSPTLIAKDITLFTVTNLVAITRRVDELPTATGERRLAIDALKEDVGLLNSLFIRSTSSIYLSGTRDVRERAKIMELISEFAEFSAKRQLTDEQYERAYDNFQRTLRSIMEVE